MTMRIRIVQLPPIADIDGVRLDCFDAGQEYDVGNTVGAFLLSEGWAEPVPLDAPKPIEPFAAGDPFDSRTLYDDRGRGARDDSRRVTPLTERAIASDMSRYSRRRPRS
jgi:hypothetical protein